MRHKAIVINQFWATIIGGLLSTAIVGGFAAYAEQRSTAEKMKAIEAANLPERIANIEGKLDMILREVKK